MQAKRFGYGKTYDFFVARKIVQVSTSSTNVSDGELVDPSNVYNAHALENAKVGTSFVRGEIIGFVDVTKKAFGLAPGFDSDDRPLTDFLFNGENTAPIGQKSQSDTPLRPVLTNLCVKEEARQSGVGSMLVEACENAVVNLWETPHDEMILEVEEDNVAAQRFYEKRGYRPLFADPTCRRYDTSGLFLEQVRTTKISYRKDLRVLKTKTVATKLINDNILFGANLLRRIREAVSSY